MAVEALNQCGETRVTNHWLQSDANGDFLLFDPIFTLYIPLLLLGGSLAKTHLLGVPSLTPPPPGPEPSRSERPIYQQRYPVT